MSEHHRHEPEQIKNHQLEELIKLNKAMLRVLLIIAEEDAPPVLTSIEIAFSKGDSTMVVAGPVVLTKAGQIATASILGFNQFGTPFTGVMPPATLSIDDTDGLVVTFDPATGLTTAVANGVANVTGSLTTAEGLALTDTESVTVTIQAAAEVLTTIKVGFDTATAAAAARR